MLGVHMSVYSLNPILEMWQDDAPIMYVVITVGALMFFCGALVISLRRQPHRLERVRRFICCVKTPLANYTSVPDAESEMARFVIVDEDEDDEGDGDGDEVEIDLDISPKTSRAASPEEIPAATV